MKRRVKILALGSFVDHHLRILEELILSGLHSFSYEMIPEDRARFLEIVKKCSTEVDFLICLGDQELFPLESFPLSSLHIIWLPAEFSYCKELIRNHCPIPDESNIVSDLQQMFVQKEKTLAVAESCTGGCISHWITLQHGSSQYYLGSFVTYSNALKKTILGVKQETLEKYGAVSSQTVQEMAQGVLRQSGSDFSIAISGVAGPEGGTKQNPVGTVWVAVGCKNGPIESQKLQILGDRQTIVQEASFQALSILFKFAIRLI